MNFGDEFTVSQGNELPFTGPWIPVTPQKPIQTRSAPISENEQGIRFGRENWQELDGFPPRYAQEFPNYNEMVQNFNPFEQMGHTGGDYVGGINLTANNQMLNNIAGSSTLVFQNESMGWNDNTLVNPLATRYVTDFASANGTACISRPNSGRVSVLQSQVDNWGQSSLRDLMCADPRPPTSFPFLRDNDDYYQLPQYGSAIPYTPMHNLNSPPWKEVGAASHIITSFESASKAQEQTKKTENKQLNANSTSASGKSLINEREKQEHVVASNGNEVCQHSSEHLQNIDNSSSAVISSPKDENRNSGWGSDEGIDLNMTPKQKQPKRRKHRPKVIVEGKPKRTPKSATTENIDSKGTPSGKRKYVRRKGLSESATELADLTKESDLNGTLAKRRYIRKKSLKDLATEQLDSTKEPNPVAGITLSQTYAQKKNQEESTTQQADCTRRSDTSYETAGKKQYIHENGPEASATPQVDCMKETENGPNALSTKRSCRRELNFDLGNAGNQSQADKLQEMPQGRKPSESQDMELQNAGNEGFKIKQSTQTSQQAASSNQPQIGSSHTTSITKTPIDWRTMSHMQSATATQLQQKGLQTGNLNVAVSNASMSNVKLSQTSYRDGYTPTQQNIHPTQISHFQQGANYQEYTDWRQKLVFERLRQSVPTALSNPNEGSGSKRGNSHAIEQEQFYAPSSMTSLSSHGVFQMNEGYINGSTSGEAFLQALKRKKMEDESRAYIYSRSYGMAHGLGKLQTKGTNNVSAKELTSLTICGASDPQFHSDNTARRSSGVRGLTEERCVYSTAAALNASKQPISFQQHSGMLRNIDGLTLVHKSPTIENTNHHLPITLEKAPTLQFVSMTQTSNNNVPENKRRQNALSRRAPSGRRKMLQEQKEQYKYQRSSKARGASAKEVYLFPIEEMTNKFMALILNEKNKAEAQNALVIYKGAGTVVPYEGFELIRRRKPRPKVDLDPETNRIWNLLMGKDKENIEGTDKEKEKWWEEERTVFEGRVDSFIARMNLVQGERKFTKWKGSVVDSVIGVFLTQNVSDQLSSSAFMSLAARFPLKSSCKSECNQDGEKVLIEEPEVCKPNTKETIKWHENLFSHQFDSQSSITLNVSTEGNSFTETHSQSLEDEVLSSQGSFDSSVIQTIGGISSYSGSNSETEDPTTGCKFSNNHGSTVDQMENSASFDSKHYNCLSASSLFQEIFNYKQLEITESGQELTFVGENLKGSSSFIQASHFSDKQLQVQAVDVSHHALHLTLESEIFKEGCLEPCAEECMSSWASNVSGFNKLKQLGKTEGKIMVQQNRQATSQDMATAVLNTSSREHMMHQHEVSQQGPTTKSNHLCNSHKEKMNKAFQSESTSVTMPLTTDAATIMRESNAANAVKLTERPPDGGRTSALNKDKHIESKDAQHNIKEQMNFSTKEHGENSTLKPKRRKAEEGKTDATDWDALRKEALANGWNSERSKDCIDSLDYEAMRLADVKEISSTIKERGMNNLLAERIKAFLNRMVKEHNSIDLEWLKHVPPDKAKDFLLSIWGLGLKSVECVRLLTLHNVAFPVDTNVGRIAVRLGWVPLQPLPESLQLHLLELYPILESIQKYLWPRLCKLEQPKLYELHYQMITFGKVFCTKSKPNCNACPMRAECRHFASAFASARLALPGPEERGITSSTVPQMPKENPVKIVSPMPLPTPYNNLLKLEARNGNHEPIIEEPATPEPEHTEDSSSDIEDAFHEDSEEIPTINLNIEEFTANLQHYMQAEVQESDLSKALVALNPQAASIPTPKLKNVSRLRTEHYVYELPDDHSLLKGIEKRQLDDPCPYLLAIWSPGETATSIQPPERSCGSREVGTLCSENTCFSCNSVREANAQTVRGTLLIPCRTAMRGSFPLNGTYFQVNEVFADHESSINPMYIPREWIWNLPRRTVYFGTSVSSIFKGLSTEGIQYCFWRGFVCVRGFDQKTRAPRPLIARLHFPASKIAKTKTEDKRESGHQTKLNTKRYQPETIHGRNKKFLT